jgi:hypothetical protein
LKKHELDETRTLFELEGLWGTNTHTMSFYGFDSVAFPAPRITQPLATVWA